MHIHTYTHVFVSRNRHPNPNLDLSTTVLSLCVHLLHATDGWMLIYMYVYIGKCVHISIDIYLYIRVCIYKYVNMYTYVHMLLTAVSSSWLFWQLIWIVLWLTANMDCYVSRNPHPNPDLSTTNCSLSPLIHATDGWQLIWIVLNPLFFGSHDSSVNSAHYSPSPCYSPYPDYSPSPCCSPYPEGNSLLYSGPQTH